MSAVHLDQEALIMLSEVAGTSVTAQKQLITLICKDNPTESILSSAPYYAYADAPVLWQACLSRRHDPSKSTNMITRWLKTDPSRSAFLLKDIMQHYILQQKTGITGWADLIKFITDLGFQISDLTPTQGYQFLARMGPIKNVADFNAFVLFLDQTSPPVTFEGVNRMLHLISRAFATSDSLALDQEKLMPFVHHFIMMIVSKNDSSWLNLLVEFFQRFLPPSKTTGNLYRCGWLGRAVYANGAECQPAIDAYRSIFPFNAERPFIEAWRDSLLSASSSRPDSDSYKDLVPWMENCLKSSDKNLHADFIHIFPIGVGVLDPAYKRKEPSWTYFWVQWAPSTLDNPTFSFADVSNWMTWAYGDLDRRVTQRALERLLLNLQTIPKEHHDPTHYPWSDAMIAVFIRGFKQKGNRDFLIVVQDVLDRLKREFFLDRITQETAEATLPKLVWESFLPAEPQGGTGYRDDLEPCLNFALLECSPDTTINAKDPANIQLAKEYMTSLSQDIPDHIYRIRNALDHFSAGIEPPDLLKDVTAYLKNEQKKKEEDQDEDYITAMEEVIAMLKPATPAP